MVTQEAILFNDTVFNNIAFGKDGVTKEPYESLVVDCDEQHQGSIIEELGNRRAEMQDLLPDGKGRVRLQFILPTRGLIGFRSAFLSMTSGVTSG